MTMKRLLMMAVLVVSVAALAVPLIGVGASAPRAASGPKGVVAPPRTGLASGTSPRVATQEQVAVADQGVNQGSAAGSISAETLKALGINRVPKGKLGQVATKAAQNISNSLAGHISPRPPGGRFNAPAGAGHVEAGPPLVGQPVVLNVNDALSAALITNIGGRDNQFSEVALIGDWDGREDCAADRGVKIDDFSFVEPEIDFSLTRAAISEHTRGNGHPFFNVYYYGDSIGSAYLGVDLTGNPLVDVIFAINFPELVNTGTSNGFPLQNPTAGDCTDDQVTVTGIAVNPVADLGDFTSGGDPVPCGTTGEVVYVSVFDSQGCASNAANQPIRSRIFAFGLFEGSDAGGGFIQFTDVRQILRSKFANIAGVAVDDDGSLYYQLLDLIQFTGGAIFKATEVCRTVANCGVVGDAPEGGPGANPRINRVINLIPDPPTLNSWSGTGANPIVTANGVRNTNYGGGSSTTWGNVVSLATGPCNVLFAAVARSFRSADDGFTQLTEGRFAAPGAFTNGTPSMVISLADCSGGFDICSGEAEGGVATNLGGILPVADGIADAATATTGTIIAGVNNFRIFVQGDGPNLAPAVGGTAVVPGTPSTLLKVAMQIDFTLHSGIAVSEEGTVFVISGGTPAGIGTNPSPLLGEVLCFEDMCPMDRRADSIDLRGDTLPNPPASGGNVGDGDSDRFDHIFYQSPLDQVTLTPAGLAGLARGFLRYTNRLVGTNALAVPLGPGVTLGTTKPVQGDDDTDGTIIFENLDPGHQVAGGDDQNTPFRGDDDNGLGTPTLVGALSGGFEFTFGGPVGTAGCVWNGFFLNSNGNITFGEGDIDRIPNVPNLRQGPPRIAPAWADFNPSSRADNLCTFPVQALGFANINAFRVRWINVPEFGKEDCVGNSSNFAGATNTFSVTLYDDGTGIDENSSKLLDPADPTGDNVDPAFDLQEGPTDLRFTRELSTGIIVGCPPRPAGSGIFLFEYCRMDLLGTEDLPVIAGYSIGGLDPLNPPGLCETNLSIAALGAETTFGLLIGNQTAAIGCNCLIGEGTEPTIFELFNEGLPARTGAGGEQVFATADFDLRGEGNDTGLCSPTRQHDLNRGKVGFLGIGCAPPANPICQTVVAGPFVTTPTTTGLVNSLCAVPLQLVGCGFFPNEVTIICQGFEAETGVPLQRPGKTVTTAATLSCDTNGDGVAESVVALVNVTPVSCNLVRATIPVSASFGTTSTSGFPSACCGGAGTVTVTTTFSSGDNNAFGPFTRTVTCAIALGTRAPIVISVTPSSGSCSIPQDLLISGACFIINGVPNVTSVFALDRANCATRINATNFVILNANLIDAFFNFTSANAGKTFLIFVSGPNGTSRNISACQAAPGGTPAGCPTGNEQGVQVTFTCNTSTPPDEVGGPIDIAILQRCSLSRDDVSGAFRLDVFGTNIKLNAAVTINGQVPKKIQFRDLEAGSTDRFTRVRLKKQICKTLNGAASIVITNPGTNGRPSVPLLCAATCPTN